MQSKWQVGGHCGKTKSSCFHPKPLGQGGARSYHRLNSGAMGWHGETMTGAGNGDMAAGPAGCGGGLTCVVQAQCEEGLARALRAVCPDFVHQVLLDRNEVVACTSQNLGHLLPVIWGEIHMAQPCMNQMPVQLSEARVPSERRSSHGLALDLQDGELWKDYLHHPQPSPASLPELSTLP